MAASIQIAPERFKLLRLAWSGPAARLAPAPPVQAYEPHWFPEARTMPTLSAGISDEALEHYAFTFCQGGFRNLGLTFEQFLLVAEAVRPLDSVRAHGDATTC
jgi:hypothetical protein